MIVGISVVHIHHLQVFNFDLVSLLPELVQHHLPNLVHIWYLLQLSCPLSTDLLLFCGCASSLQWHLIVYNCSQYNGFVDIGMHVY